ncbi:MAG: carboxypeptidase regulatory-like domain-containing protein [Deltaproteobacteria bacterium]|nr:carboxypeptidase regulatory-like domain-containing protein [Deltaproteobacteria bacterium]
MVIKKWTTKKTFTFLLFGFCLLLFSGPIPCHAATYERYVDINNGTDDTGHGTSSGAGAWKTLHYAIQQINALSPLTSTDTCIVYVAQGTYSVVAEADAELILMQSYVTILGNDDPKPVIDATGAAIWADGLEIQGSNAVVTNLVIKNFAAFSSGIMISGLNNAVVNCNLQYNEYGVYITGAGSQSNIIEACDIHHNGYGVFLQETGTGNTIDNCQIYSNRDYGVKIQSSPDSAVLNSAIYWTTTTEGGDGIYVEYSDAVIFQNRVYENFSFGILVQGCSPIIWQNRVYDNGDGIMVAGETYEASPQIWNNLIYETDTSLYNMIQGIGVESWDGLAGASPVIYHNTLDHGPYYGIHVGNSTTATIDPDIKYNIITNFGAGGIWCDGPVTTIDYNDVWNNGAGGSVNYYGCAAGGNDISSDPQYAATGHALQPGSPCIDKIPPLPNPPYDPVSIDINGDPRPQGSGFDIGCYEYSGTYTATISGRVTDSTGTPLSDIRVNAVDNKCNGNVYGSVSDENGDYAIPVPEGKLYVVAHAFPSHQNYTLEWWNEGNGTPDCRLATSVTALADQTTGNIDFALAAGGSVSGTVTDSHGDPIQNLHIYAEAQGCGGNWLGGTETDVNGNYQITGLPGGNTYVTACATCSGLAYITEWYDNVTDCDYATAVQVTVDDDTPNIDFSLHAGGVISGRVTDGGGNPLNNITVNAIDNKCVGNWYHSSTNETGEYMVVVPTGTYYVLAIGSHVYQNYVLEWWNDGDGTPDCNQAAPVAAEVEQTTGNIDFVLAAGGSLSGKVTDTNGDPIPNLEVVAHSQNCGGNWLGSMNTDPNGEYRIAGLPQGNTYVNTDSPRSGLYYRDEWYNNVLTCDQATAVPITIGQDTPGIDFSLINVEGTTITGTVYQSNGTTPLGGIQICAWPFPGGTNWCTTSQSDGTYSLTNVQPGYLKVEASGGGYLTEYYNNAYDPHWATAVWIGPGQTTPNINFSMGTSGSISGKVFKGDGVTPLANVCVGAFMHQCASNRYAGAQTDANGNYTISNLPPQTYYLAANAACTTPQHYQLEWWNGNDGGGTLICDQADSVTVVSGGNTSPVNFSLDSSKDAYPGPKITSSALFSAHLADGTIQTHIWARISGPSPQDVASFTATGPSGTFNLNMLQPPFRQLGTTYIASVPSVLQNGAYAFVITDSLGRTATVTRNFTYDATVPQVASSTMKVEGKDNYAYVGTTTPTLTWDEVAGAFTYQLFIYDCDGQAIWYFETTGGTTVTVPEGYLQPDTPYYWWVRVNDVTGENRHFSDTLYFYTGTKAFPPDLTEIFTLSFACPDYSANWFAARNINLAPWDISSFNVTGPNGTVYLHNNRSFRFHTPVFEGFFSGGGPLPTPDGTYTFELTDTDSNTYTQTKAFTYNPISPISEASRSPAPNAYVYTGRTFSWAPVSDSRTLYYKLRIRDYNSRIVWYESPYSTETSCTIPDSVPRAPYGSYKWQVLVTDSPTDPKNMSMSALRTITSAPLSQYVYTLPGGTGVATDYRMFTVPLYTGTVKDFLQLMEKTLGFYNPMGSWRIFLYVNNAYYEINSPSIQSMPYAPGNAAWIISRDATEVLFSGGTEPKGTYPMNLKGNSWHMIGLPWSDTGIELSKIAVSDGTNTYFITDEANPLTGHVVWEYTGTGPYSGYVQRGVGDSLAPGTGYFFKVTAQNDVRLLIPPDNSGTQFSVQAGRGLEGKKLNRVYEEEPPPPPGAQPASDIKANGQDGSITVSSGNLVSVAVTLDPGAWAGRDADWWLAAYTPFSWYTYIHTMGWQPGIHRCIQTPLIPLSTPVEVLNMPLPKGHYIFYFAVDGNADGIPDATWMDSVGITVE